MKDFSIVLSLPSIQRYNTSMAGSSDSSHSAQQAQHGHAPGSQSNVSQFQNSAAWLGASPYSRDFNSIHKAVSVKLRGKAGQFETFQAKLEAKLDMYDLGDFINGNEPTPTEQMTWLIVT
jgi:hypothetical protein